MDTLGCAGHGVCIGSCSPGEGTAISWVLFSVLLEPQDTSLLPILPNLPWVPPSPLGILERTIFPSLCANNKHLQLSASHRAGLLSPAPGTSLCRDAGRTPGKLPFPGMELLCNTASPRTEPAGPSPGADTRAGQSTGGRSSSGMAKRSHPCAAATAFLPARLLIGIRKEKITQKITGNIPVVATCCGNMANP